MFNPQKIEKKWQKIWQKEKTYETNLKEAKKPFYNLMMFPYPSAEGLHVGNMYAFVGSDIYGRLKRMQGYDVFEPIGLDGFGIHSENYALKVGTHPVKQAKISEKRFYKQLQMIGNSFSWDKRLETYDPAYYKWTQWIFIQMFKNGLAYRKKASVNWCPSCKTVLADEQVINGKCERCSNNVLKKELEQWFFKITKYAERLLKNLDKIDWSEKVKIAQRNWIGRSEGALIKFPISNFQFSIEVFTTRPDTLFGATYLVLSPEHPLLQISNSSFFGRFPTERQFSIFNLIKNKKEVENYIKKAKKKTEEERIAEAKEKTGVELKGVKAINPANKKEIPIFVADYVLASYGTGAIMAVPGHDQRDFEFAKKYKLPIREVIQPYRASPRGSASPWGSAKFIPYEDEGVLINSGRFNGLPSEKARWLITKFVGGKKENQYHLRDWLISRQRYWGPPIPIIYCRKCWETLNHKSKNQKLKLKEGIDYAVFDGKEYIIHPVPEKDLPVKLPFVKDFRPTGKGVSPLASVKSFYEVKCPQCGSKARRETDVSDTFLDSAWYYIGYLIINSQKSTVNSQKSPFSNSLVRKWLPVDMYIGGAEHAVLHLLYSRFLAMVFYDLGIIHFEEPFSKFRAHGLLIKEGAKMSKSKGNVVNPDEYIKKFGADILRMYLMFLAPFEYGGDFRDAGILGIKRFLERVWRFSKEMSLRAKRSNLRDKKIASGYCPRNDYLLDRLLHQTIKKVTEDIESLNYNTAISALMVLFNEIEKNKESIVNSQWSSFLKLLAPFAPHLAEELWQQFFRNPKFEIRNPKQIQNSKTQKSKRFKSIHLESWPTYDPKLIEEEKFELVIQINGKVRDKISVATNISQKEAENLALSREKIKNWLKDKEVKKIIFVPKRLINIVV
jgi:leucyl-tRNA synthetase